MSDDLEGWVTPVGNQGTVFLEDGGNVFKVVKDTILTGTFIIGGETKQKDFEWILGRLWRSCPFCCRPLSIPSLLVSAEMPHRLANAY